MVMPGLAAHELERLSGAGAVALRRPPRGGRGGARLARAAAGARPGGRPGRRAGVPPRGAGGLAAVETSALRAEAAARAVPLTRLELLQPPTDLSR